MPASTKSRTAAKRKQAATSTSKRRPPAKGRSKGTAGGAGRGPKTRARRSLLASRGPAMRRGAPVFESHHVDIAALALIAVGIFVAGVAYAGWSGGALGGGAVTVLRFLLGALGYVVPAALVLTGALILVRELRPPARPLRTGTICLTIALTLGLAAGTFGIGPGAAPAGELWRAASMESRGGILGAAEYWICAHLISHVGADILAVFLLVAGGILVSGAGLAGALQMTGAHVASTGRALREVSSAGTLGRRPATAAGDGTSGDRIRGRRSVLAEPESGDEFDPLADSDPTHPDEIVVRAAEPSLEELPVPEPADALGDGAGPTVAEPAGPDADGLDSLPELGFDDSDQPQLEEDEPDGDGGPGREVDEGELTPQGRYRASVTEDPDFVWRVPSPRFLTRSTSAESRPDTAGQAQTARSLVEALGHFGIDAQVVGKVSGPHITRYEIKLAPGVKMSKVANLKDDLAYALAATDIRILAPIPGKQAVGIEVPNARRRIVHLGDVVSAAPEDWSPLTVWLGKDIAGKAVGADLAKMPHLLVAGTTGAGKSACVNAMLSSILLRATPHEVRLVLVDPKQVELNHYESIPHLLTPVITSPRQAANALQNLVREMEQRYSIMQLARTRSLPDLNRVRESRGEPPLPYILCVIDELADLMMVAPADVEDSIIRLAQKARAVGMHLVLATQSPRVDVITGMIKANVPSRIAFAVSSQTDSRVILDQNGAESLLGQGDMLFSPVGSSRLQRIQGAFIDEAQILEITEAWRKQGEPDLKEELLLEVESEDDGSGPSEDPNDADSDPLLEEAIALVAQMGTASTSMLQRRLRLGYTRAGRLIDMLERRGIISGYEGSKPRQVLIGEGDVPRILVNLAEVGRGSSSAGAGGSGTSESTPPARGDAGEETVIRRLDGPAPDGPSPHLIDVPRDTP
jgi:S-DNA-T family DNA segregation ATPase FtsK/SpoIIIE